MPNIRLAGPNIRGGIIETDVPHSSIDPCLERWVKVFQARGYKVTKCAPYLFDISTIAEPSRLIGVFTATEVV